MIKPAKRRKRVSTDIGGVKGRIELVPGANPYLWIGQNEQCVGAVADQDVKKLRDMCDEILNRRAIERLERLNK